MTEQTYVKAKSIMDEVEKLRSLKSLDYPPECYSIEIRTVSGNGVIANQVDIGVKGVEAVINTYVTVIDNLIADKLKELEVLE